MHDPIRQKYLQYSQWNSRLIVLKPDDALSMLNEYIENNYKIVSIEGFYIREHRGRMGIQPAQEYSMDYKLFPHLSEKEIQTLAVAFIQERVHLPVFFELYCSDTESEK